MAEKKKTSATKTTPTAKGDAKTSIPIQRHGRAQVNVSASAEAEVKSYACLLQQGIQSNDVEKVDKAIKACARDRESTFQTAKDIDASKVVPLLQFMDKVFRDGQQKRKSNMYLRDLKYWVDFLEVTLQAHSTFLSSVTNLEQQIGGLVDYVGSRTTNLEKLMKLEGKLSFFCDQIHRRLNPVKHVRQQPAVIFEDDLSDSDIDPTKEVSADMDADTDDEADWFAGTEGAESDEQDESMDEN